MTEFEYVVRTSIRSWVAASAALGMSLLGMTWLPGILAEDGAGGMVWMAVCLGGFAGIGLNQLLSKVVLDDGGVLLVAFPLRWYFAWDQIQSAQVGTGRLSLLPSPILRIRGRKRAVALWPAAAASEKQLKTVQEIVALVQMRIGVQAESGSSAGADLTTASGADGARGELIWMPAARLRTAGGFLAVLPNLSLGVLFVLTGFFGTAALVGWLVVVGIAVPAGFRLLLGKVVVGNDGVLLVSFPFRRKFGWDAIESIEVVPSRLGSGPGAALRIRNRRALVRLWPATLAGRHEGRGVDELVEAISSRSGHQTRAD